MAEKVEKSDLSQHRKRRWGYEVPIDESLREAIRFTSWFVERLPECLWWDAVNAKHGAAGFARARRVLDAVHNAIGDDMSPPLGFVSDFARVPLANLEEVRDIYAIELADLRDFHGVVALYKDHPMSWLVIGLPAADSPSAERYLAQRIAALEPRRARPAVDAQAGIISEIGRRGKLYLPAEATDIVEALVNYPNSDFDLAAAAINSMMITQQSLFRPWLKTQPEATR